MVRRRRDLEQGEEYCPVCGRISFPGACKPCRHYVGGVWDGQIIHKTRHLENLVNAWQEMSELRESFSEAGFDFDDCVVEMCKKFQIERDLGTVANYYDQGEGPAIQQLVSFYCGEDIITGGMLSGSGYNLYLKKQRATLGGLTRDYRRISAALRRKLALLQKKHSSSQASS